jgi:hypothetical protein
MLLPLRNLLLDTRRKDFREFGTSPPRSGRFVTDRDPALPREQPYWTHPPIYTPPPRPRAEPVATIDELLLRSLARSEPTEEEMILLMAA